MVWPPFWEDFLTRRTIVLCSSQLSMYVKVQNTKPTQSESPLLSPSPSPFAHLVVLMQEFGLAKREYR